jgi:anti-sigma factor RsiW
MKQNTTPPDDSWESDAVWKLLEQAAPMKAPDRFAENTVRAARLLVEVKPWWSRLFSPAPLAGLAGATAALAFAVTSWVGPAPTSVSPQNSAQAVAIEDISAAETLIAAADHLDDFSDSELVSLIGF